MSIEPDKDKFARLCTILMQNVDMFGEGPPDVPWKGRAKPSRKQLDNILNKTSRLLPLRYQQAYVTPLKDHIDLVLAQADRQLTLWDLETLLGAIYDHADQEIAPYLQQFLSVVSNVYRSFLTPDLGPERLRKPTIQRSKWLPPLAVFKHKLHYEDFSEVSPYSVPVDTIRSLFGGNVGLVCVPSSYRKHPLFWTSLSHEVGGHDVLHAKEELLPELQEAVRNKFPETFSKKNGPTLEGPALADNLTQEQLTGLLWQYWTEEAACDVYAVMNMGPIYGIALALYHVALNQSIRRGIATGKITIPGIDQFLWRKKNDINKKEWDSLNKMQPKAAFEKICKQWPEMFKPYQEKWKVDVLSLRNWSGMRPDDRDNIRDDKGQTKLIVEPHEIKSIVDPHPIDLLKLYVIIGAIESFVDKGLKGRWDDYAQAIRNVAEFCAQGATEARIHGWLQTTADSWRLVDEFHLNLKNLQESAEKFGNCIATAELEALGNTVHCHGTEKRNIQYFETWDTNDEKTAERIMSALINEHEICGMGDDAQLLAGAMLAAFENPELYPQINELLGQALVDSFNSDPFWHELLLVHPMFSWTSSPGGNSSSGYEKPTSYTRRRKSQSRKGSTGGSVKRKKVHP